MKNALILLLLWIPSAFATSPALCEKKPAPSGMSLFDCAIPGTTEEQGLRITNDLRATYTNYQTTSSSGIRVVFYSPTDRLRTVDLDYDAVASETEDKSIVALAGKLPRGRRVVGLEFEAVAGSQSLTLRVVYPTANNQLVKVDVFSAE